MSRPHLSKSIDQLEDLFAGALSDQDALRGLSEELAFRRTARAKELLGEVSAALQKFGPQPSPKKNESTASPFPPAGQSANQDSRESHTNFAEDVLGAWSALEVLSPTTFKRRAELAGNIAQNIVSIGPEVPWQSGSARSKPNFKVYFHIILGTLAAEPAFGQLLRRYQDSRVNPPNIKGEVILASILVDKDGRLAGEMPVSLSAFAWAFPRALKGALNDLPGWKNEESRLVEDLTKQLRPNPSGTDTPLRFETLQRAFKWLVDVLDLPADLVQGPQFAVAAYVGFRSSVVPDPLLLNSFYLRDLSHAKDRAARGALPATLERFLGRSLPSQRRDLLNDSKSLEEALSPRCAPTGRWITPQYQRPALLQQAAVNLVSQLSSTNPLLGVNGPPGTGKSTLLRDVVADQLTRRAEAMCKFDDPATAFRSAWSKRTRGETQELYAIDTSLRGFEMVVASSNNKAVENVSAEIPALASIAPESALRYFEPLATQLLGKDAWGLMTAVLGNGSNRSRFRKAFWTESNLSFKSYLEQVSGITPIQEGAPAGLAQLCRAPTNRAEALQRWRQAKHQFLQQSAGVRKRLAELEKLRVDLSAIPHLQDALDLASARHRDSQLAATLADESRSAAEFAYRTADIDLEAHNQAVNQHGQSRPRFFALKRLFGSADAVRWAKEEASLLNVQQESSRIQVNAKSDRDRAYLCFEGAQSAASACAKTLESSQSDLDAALARCDQAKVGDGACVIDDAFYWQSHSERNTSLPWLDRELQIQRSALFEGAMAVHRAFIDAAALPLLRNLQGLVGGNFRVGTDRKQMVADLWSSLFLVVPVVSTAFASVERMLSQLPDESLGWLLVDEAGQATPQSAVGAMLRAKRAVVVGDPLQVEPVVTLPPALTQAIMKEFGVDPDRFAAPSASVQTLADDASLHCARFETTSGCRAVGAPLLVHRRCASPMFEISNRVAYNNLMVQAKQAAGSTIREALGPSRWIDVRGGGRDKYSADEGQEVLGLLRTLRASQQEPDLYIVTPFVVVQDELRELIGRSGVLNGWVENASAWVYERVGTVHTVQGREAQAVIFVLGAPQAAQHGARQWAGSAPNLLNVAVTRAKEAIYVVGNRSLWSGAGHFATLYQAL